jgi:hypothetical protein
VKNASQSGIVAVGVSGLQFTNILCEGNTLDGINLINVSSVGVNNITARGNKRHGLNIGDGSHDIVIAGGMYTSNGTGGFISQTGAGINMYSDRVATYGITIQGPMTIGSNTAVGLWISAGGATGHVSSVSVADGDTVYFDDNAESGVVVYGQTDGIIVRGRFRKSTSTSVGIVLAGYQNPSTPAGSPQNTTIVGSVFSGYDMLGAAGHPAITLSTGTLIGRFCPNDAVCSSSKFLDAAMPADIPNYIFDKKNDARLGEVVLTNPPLPVELVAFNAIARGEIVDLSWVTATETENLGFDIERSPVDHPLWSSVAFVPGNGTSSVPRQYSYVDHPPKGKFSYRLKQIDRNGAFHYSKEVTVNAESIIPANLILGNYPNPFNPATTLHFSLPAAGQVRLTVYDALGAEVTTIIDGQMEAGTHEVRWNAEKFPGGTYFYVIHVNNSYAVQRMMLLR